MTPPPPSPTEHRTVPAGAAPTIRKAGSAATTPRFILIGVEGSGKSTLGAFAPKPLFLMSGGETGIETLVKHNRVPEVDCVELTDWQQTLAYVRSLRGKKGEEYQTFVLDTLSGYERLCHEYICTTMHGGDWGEKGFMNYQKGYRESVPEIMLLLRALDDLRAENKTIILLEHHTIKTFRNPVGADYDRFTSRCNSETWQPVSAWADAVLFLDFVNVVQQEKGQRRAKGIGGSDRILYCEHTDARDAKNRFGLPAEIELPDNPAQMWATLDNAINQKGGAE